MGNAAAGRIAIQCACGVKLKVPASAAGRRAKCPKCGEPFTVPVPAETTASAPAAPPADDLLGDLVAQERAATVTAPQPGAATVASAPPRPCPHCGVVLAGGAVVCTSCGYNLQTGRQIKGARIGPGVAGVAAKTAKVAGTFLLGCILSVVAATIGAGVWYFIAMKTGYEIGYVAWGIGLITGFGMALGSRTSGVLPGAVAAIIAFASIVAAKMLIFVVLIYGALTGDTANHQIQQEYVKIQIAQATLREKGIDPEKATKEQYAAAYDDAARRVKTMKGAEFEREYQRLRALDSAAEEADETEESPAVARETSATPPDNQSDSAGSESEASVSVLGIFFSTMFGLFDILFVGLAIVSAFKVGASGMQFGGGD